MLEFITGKWTIVAGAATAIVAMLATLFFVAKKAGKDEQRAKEADARAKEIERIAVAGSAKPTGSVSDDPNNRDRKGSVSNLDARKVQRKPRQ